MFKHGLLVGILAAYVCGTCASFCTLQYDPVCGSDGKTYSNNCFLALRMAKNPQLQLKYKGQCEKHDRKTRSVVCSTEIKNVCGSDGRTYRNPCVLNHASNPTNKIELLHYGACNNNSVEIIANQTHKEIKKSFINVSNSEHVQSLINKTQTEPEIKNPNTNSTDQEKSPVKTKNATKANEKPSVELSCPCGLELEEICGINGVTYDHPCLRNCTAKLNKTFDIHFEGRCNGSELIVVDRKRRSIQISNNVHVSYNINKPNRTITINGKQYFDDDDIFGRELMPEIARRLKRDTEKAKETKKPEIPAAELLCPCPRNLWLLCGTDGVTYDNECLFECAQKMNGSLRIQFEGRCDGKDMFGRDIKANKDEAPTKHNPDGNTKDASGYKHDSSSHNDVALDTPKKNAELLCACPKNIRKVCGTDGQTYVNHCLLKCAGKGDKKITMKHEGSCEDRDTVEKQIFFVIPPTRYPSMCKCPPGPAGVFCRNIKCSPAKTLFVDEPESIDNNADKETEAKKGLPCECPENYKRVCGSDGVTYENLCHLKCSAKSDESIKLMHEGSCAEKVEFMKRTKRHVRNHANIVTFRH